VGSNPTSPVALLMLSLRLLLHKLVGQNQQLGSFLFILLDWFINIFKITRLDNKNSDLLVIYTYKEKLFLSSSFYFYFLDVLYLYFYYCSSSVSLNLSNVFSMSLKTKQLNNSGFYLFNNTFNVYSLNQLYLYGLRSI